MNYKNKEIFEKFLSENMNKPYNIDACYEDFERQIGASGSSSYELPGHETKSGHPESIYFERKDHFFLDEKEIPQEKIGDNDFDYVETTIIF